MLFSDLFVSSLKKLADPQRAMEIELLIAKAFGMDRRRFWIVKQDAIQDQGKLLLYRKMFKRLLAGEPLSYILGEKEFFSYAFKVDRHVLIPRPETELLVESALQLVHESDRLLEIGVGSGVIAISLALTSGCRVIAVDNSLGALAVCRRNITQHGLSRKVMLVQADLFPPVKAHFDFIVTNPPYLSDGDWEELPGYIKHHEPKNALVAGPTGVEVIERIITRAPDFLLKAGVLLLEAGAGQRALIERLLKNSVFSSWKWAYDHQGVARVLMAKI